MPRITISDTNGIVQQAGSGLVVNSELSLGAGLTTAQGATVIFSSDPGVLMKTGVSGSTLDFPLEITGSAGSECATGIKLWGTGSGALAGLGAGGTDVGILKAVPAGAVVIFFDSTAQKLKIKFGSTIQTITSS